MAALLQGARGMITALIGATYSVTSSMKTAAQCMYKPDQDERGCSGGPYRQETTSQRDDSDQPSIPGDELSSISISSTGSVTAVKRFADDPPSFVMDKSQYTPDERERSFAAQPSVTLPLGSRRPAAHQQSLPATLSSRQSGTSTASCITQSHGAIPRRLIDSGYSTYQASGYQQSARVCAAPITVPSSSVVRNAPVSHSSSHSGYGMGRHEQQGAHSHPGSSMHQAASEPEFPLSLSEEGGSNERMQRSISTPSIEDVSRDIAMSGSVRPSTAMSATNPLLSLQTRSAQLGHREMSENPISVMEFCIQNLQYLAFGNWTLDQIEAERFRFQMNTAYQLLEKLNDKLTPSPIFTVTASRPPNVARFVSGMPSGLERNQPRHSLDHQTFTYATTNNTAADIAVTSIPLTASIASSHCESVLSPSPAAAPSTPLATTLPEEEKPIEDALVRFLPREIFDRICRSLDVPDKAWERIAEHHRMPRDIITDIDVKAKDAMNSQSKYMLSFQLFENYKLRDLLADLQKINKMSLYDQLQSEIRKLGEK